MILRKITPPCPLSPAANKDFPGIHSMNHATVLLGATVPKCERLC